MTQINVVSSTQQIIVNAPSRTARVVLAGPQGPPGVQVVPSGGTTGQVLAKLSNADYDVGWVTPA